MRTTLLSLSLLLGACGGDEPDDSPCALWFPDTDGDGFGDQDGLPVLSCEATVQGRANNNADCDDSNDRIHPDAVEVCDLAGVDEDCDWLFNDDDDVVIGIHTWADADGDGYGDPDSPIVDYCTPPADRSLYDTDCDDSDPATHPGAAELDSATACMTDADGDGFGEAQPAAGGTAGSDCDDVEPQISPDAIERLGDEVDQDCDGDAEWFVSDDFELGEPDPRLWAVAVEVRDSPLAASGDHALSLSTGSELISHPFDTTPCEAPVWSYQGRGPEVPRPSDALQLQLHDGSDWVTIDSWDGGSEAGFVSRGGPVLVAGARHPSLQLRLITTGVDPSDAFLVDDLRLACSGPDADGDAFGNLEDCNDSDAAHWSDCGVCIDADADGFGTNCNLGDDCDDANADVLPGGSDPFGDSVDSNCDGFDGPVLFDDFELGAPAPWWSTTGDVGVSITQVYSGGYSLELGGNGGTLISDPVDLSICPQVQWHYQGKRGPETPDPGDDLVLSWFDGDGWIVLDVLAGNGATDPDFQLRQGIIADPAARSSDFQLRLRNNGSGAGFDHFFIDELTVSCAP